MPACDHCYSVKQRVKRDILKLGGVTGIGVGHSEDDEDHRLVVYVTQQNVQTPFTLEGVPVQKKVTDVIRSFALITPYPVVRTFANAPPIKSFAASGRPVAGGDSVGAYSNLLQAYVTGTVGMGYTDGSGQALFLSDNHVIAGIDTVQRGGATPGSALFSPGPYFGGQPGLDNFATLYRDGKINETGTNHTDWANGLGSDPSQISNSILNIGVPDMIADPSPGMTVQKMGALSGLTQGKVIDTAATIQVNYEDLFVATFEDQIIVDSGGNFGFAKPGDSGSVVVVKTPDGHIVAVGDIFSGSSQVGVAQKMTALQQPANINLPLGTLAGATLASGGGSIFPIFLAFVGAASYLLTRDSF